MGFQEKLLEGKLNYYHNATVYCEEFFKVFQDSSTQNNYMFTSEIMSRVKTGEFLKIYTDYELSFQFEPISSTIRRSLGAKKSTETFLFEPKDQSVKYNFNSLHEKKSDEKTVNSKPHFSSPSFATSLMMTNIRKPDPVHRTPYQVVFTQNLWSYDHSAQEKTIHVELVNSKPKSIKLMNGKEVEGIHLKVFDHDRLTAPHAQGHDFYVSKYFQIPYRAELIDGTIIEIESLKNFQVDHSNLFKS